MHVAVSSLSKHFGRVVALDDVTLQIAQGQIVAVLGANGAGKTTLLRALAGIVAADEGEIRYDGKPFRRERLDLRRRFCFLPDFPEVFADHTVLGHICMTARVYEAERPGLVDAVVALLREFQLLALAEARLATLSRGEKYKAALAGLLAVDPEVWLLDEPFASGMDPPAIAAFRRHTRRAAARGRTIVYTTQIVELTEQFSDRVCALFRGRVAAFGPIHELRQRAATEEPLAELLGGLEEGDGS